MILLFPIIFIFRGKSKWWSPVTPMMVIIAIGINFLLPLYDTSTDAQNGSNYIRKDEIWFGVLTLILPFLPFMVKSMMIMISLFKTMWKDLEVVRSHWKGLLKTTFWNGASQLPLIAQISHLPSIMKMTKLQDGAESDDLQTHMATHNSYEAFHESGPQMVLQLYILLANSSQWTEWTTLVAITIPGAMTIHLHLNIL